MPDNNYIKTHILKPILDRVERYQHRLAEQLLKAYELSQQMNPAFTHSLRQLENVAWRIVVLTEAHLDPNEDALVMRACVAEFAFSIANQHQRATFIEALAFELKVDHPRDVRSDLMMITPNCHIPREKFLLIDAIEQDLLLRQYAIKHPKTIQYKPCVLLEGDSGIGKSYILKALLEKQGLRAQSTNPTQKYYELSVARDKAIIDTLRKAAKEGAAVILDEFSQDESLFPFLSELLTADNPGFILFASQNPAYFKGRQSEYSSLINRLNLRYMDDYSDNALRQIAKSHHIQGTKEFVQGYHRCKTSLPETNMRVFYSGISLFSNTKSSKVEEENNGVRLN